MMFVTIEVLSFTYLAEGKRSFSHIKNGKAMAQPVFVMRLSPKAQFVIERENGP